ncbi:MAG: helix-turn-helix domain-containing protein [Gemmatimonadaceae bacterium]
MVVACGLSGHQRAYVVDGLRRYADCQFIDSFDDLDRMLSTLTRCDALVLAPQDQRGRDALGTVERVARDWPGTAVVIFCPARTDPAPSIRQLILAGAHEIVFEGVHPTAAKLAQAVENARRECAAETVFLRLQPLIPAQLHSMVHAVVARPDILTSVAELGAALGVHRKTLVNRCTRSDFLQPAELIMWCRLAMVGHMLERTGSTVESIALTLGFASHTALRNLVKRYTGRRATDIRREGGLALVLFALGRRIEARRGRELPIP